MMTPIVFTLDGGMPVPSVAAVAVVSGDSISLSVKGGRAVLFFSPELAAVVSPAPGTSVELSDGPAVEFKFLSSEAGAYFIVAGLEGEAAPHFGSAPSGHLKISTVFSARAVAFPVSGGETASNN